MGRVTPPRECGGMTRGQKKEGGHDEPHPAPDRRPSPHLPAGLRQDAGGLEGLRRRRRGRSRLERGERFGPDGPARDRHRHHLDCRARDLFRGPGRGTRAGAAPQRVLGALDPGPSGPFRSLCGAAASRRRRRAEGARVCSRHLASRRGDAPDQPGGPLSGGSRSRCTVRRDEPAQDGAVHPSHRPSQQPAPRDGDPGRPRGVRVRHDPYGGQSDLQRHDGA